MSQQMRDIKIFCKDFAIRMAFGLVLLFVGGFFLTPSAYADNDTKYDTTPSSPSSLKISKA